MNVATFVLAASLNIRFQASTGEMPFEVLPDPLTLFTDWTPQNMDLKPCMGLTQADSQLKQFNIPEGEVRHSSHIR
jgi:hypothetical protein